MNKYLSMITLYISILNAQIKRHMVAEWIRKYGMHICCLQDTRVKTKHLQQLKVKGWKTNVPSKQEKKCQDSNTYFRQNRCQNKGHKKAQGRTLHNTQGKNPSRRHKYYKYISTQHKSTQIYKENLGGLQERYRQQHTYTRAL